MLAGQTQRMHAARTAGGFGSFYTNQGDVSPSSRPCSFKLLVLATDLGRERGMGTRAWLQELATGFLVAWEAVEGTQIVLTSAVLGPSRSDT